MSTRKLTLQIDRARHAESRKHDSALPALAPERVRLRIERFAITANTVTCATTDASRPTWPASSRYGIEDGIEAAR
jgi:hypothetical protein